VIGGWVFNLLKISTADGVFGSLITAFVGALLLLWIISLFKKNR
ncbi:MAG: GlsB/YeaQ/YmgE family stress response membrane protein, partial [Bacteroidales bacterium]|nr:GlsB/YeaQ/YmgE family stress response membrane protein [Bacteroidales bacterium]